MLALFFIVSFYVSYCDNDVGDRWKHLELNVIPRVGFGTAGLGNKTADLIHQLLVFTSTRRVFIDTAQAEEWYSERSVRNGIIRFLLLNNIHDQSQQQFLKPMILSKIHPRHYEAAKLHGMSKKSNEILNIEWNDLDILLLHNTRCWQQHCAYKDEFYSWEDALRVLEYSRLSNNAKHIGISNFNLPETKRMRLLSHTKLEIMQNWCDPLHQDIPIRRYAMLKNLSYIAYSSFGTQHMVAQQSNPIISNEILRSIAINRNVSVYKVILSWLLQTDAITIPRSSKLSRIIDNSFDQEAFLDDKELDEIISLNSL